MEPRRLTWRHLKAEIENIEEGYLDFPVSVYTHGTGEFYEAESVNCNVESDVLSEGEPYIVIDDA